MYFHYSDPISKITIPEFFPQVGDILPIQLKERRASKRFNINLSMEDAKKLQQQLNELLK